jgi:hypothetical protein
LSAVRVQLPAACYVRLTMPGDTWIFLPTVRQSDADELAALGVTPEQCMREGMRHSRRSFAMFVYGYPAAMFGVVEHVDHAVPWMVACTAVERFPIPFLRFTKRFVDSLPMFLENAVDARNVKTIEWLRWLGFTTEEPEPMGRSGELFHKFWRAQKEQSCAGG